MSKKAATQIMSAVLVLVLCAGAFPTTPASQRATKASATEVEELEQEVSELEQKVTESASAYNSAVSRQEELASEIEELDGKIATLEEELPAQQERSDDSLCALYKFQSDTSSVVMMLLSSDNITDMLSLLDQYTWIIDYNTAEIQKTIRMETELEESKEKLENDKADADAAAEEAANTLAEAKAAREEAQQAALEAQQAEEEAKQAEAAAEEAAATTSAEKKAAKKKSTSSKKSSSQSSASNVDWSSDKSEFVDKWASRIDSYLSGSPTAGCGEYYAAAAWDYGVDPRWAPAISCIESGKGASCFRSYNAWGFGSSGFGSWEEGIYTVVAKLGSSTYGGYLTRAAASTYCPSDPDSWYSNVSAEMSKI